MINIRSIIKLTDGDGMTLKMGVRVNYKSGWQVATDGIVTASPREAINAVKAYGGNCGVWYENGLYYVDHCKRVQTKHEAMKIGIECNQISVFRWRDMTVVYCN